MKMVILNVLRIVVETTKYLRVVEMPITTMRLPETHTARREKKKTLVVDHQREHDEPVEHSFLIF